ncbi:MAG: glycoside hydrolase family 5 protein [Pseudomonadota bacterium]
MINHFSKMCAPLLKLMTAQLQDFTKIAVGCAFILPISFAQAAVAPLTVSGNKVLIGGQQGSLAGNSMFWSNTGWGNEKYYNASVVSWLKTDWKSTLVRAAMGADDAGGYLSDPSNKTRVTTVVDAAIANDMYVLIDWHSHKAEQYQSQSIAFFKEMATKYGNTNNVIYEIYNEPLQVSWSGVIKPYAQAVIAAIRAIDPDNLIVVGTPSWSQDVDVAANDPIAGVNIAYTLHFYAGTHGQSLRDKAQIALNKGVALFVTEWGSVNADGGGAVANSETAAWVDFMKTNKISHANWALNDKAEGASSLVPGASSNGGWVSSQLTASGALVKSIILAWPPVTGGTTSSTAAASSTPRSSVAPSSVPRSSVPASSAPRSSVAASSVASGSGCGSTNFNKTAVKGLDLTAVAGDCIKFTKTFGTLQIGSWAGVASTYNITSGAQGITHTGGGWTAVAASNTTLYIKVVSASRSFTVKFETW